MSFVKAWIGLLCINELSIIINIVYINEYTKNGNNYSLLYYISNILSLIYTLYKFTAIIAAGLGWSTYNDLVFILLFSHL